MNVHNAVRLTLRIIATEICILLLCSGIPARSQSRVSGRVVDAASGFSVPFAVIQTKWQEVGNADLSGGFDVPSAPTLAFSHPLYHDVEIAIQSEDSVLLIEMQKKEIAEVIESPLSTGENILKQFYNNLVFTNPANIPAYETINFNTVRVYKKSRNTQEDPWQPETEYQLIEKSRHLYPDKRFHRILKSSFTNGDTSTISNVPFSDLNISPFNHFIVHNENRFISPLHPDGQKYYHYHLLDSLMMGGELIYVLYTVPRKIKRFLGVEGVFYIDKVNFGLRAFLYYTRPEKVSNSMIAGVFRYVDDRKSFPENLYLEMVIPHLPKFKETARLIASIDYSLPSFELQDSSQTKWINLVLFDRYDSAKINESWAMDPVKTRDSEMLAYIRKDTTSNKFVWTKWLQILGNIYEGKAAIRLPLVDLKNVLSINQFETLRLGLGIQTHRELSNLITLGGYTGYGFKDKQWKYGGNFGFYLGARRQSLLSYTYRKDLREPGRNTYFERRPNYLRNFFAKRMDNIETHEITFSTSLEQIFSVEGKLSRFTLHPNYNYSYAPPDASEAITDNFGFLVTSFKIRIGFPFEHNLTARELFYRNRKVFPNLYINLDRGHDGVMGGEFDYWRLDATFDTYWDFSKAGYLETTLDAGVMNIDQPYQVMFNGNGSDDALVGIIVNRSFQTMRLYRYVSDRYLSAFLKYSFPLLNLKNPNFKPELAAALNMGWGTQNSHPGTHDSADVQFNGYGKGYYEMGLMINRLLSAKFYKYLYGSLGIGGFYGYGVDLGDHRFALRLTYHIGTL